MRFGKLVKSPEEILKWQQKYSNIGFALDKIPFKVNKSLITGWTFDEINFDKYGEISKKRIHDALKVRTEYNNFKYYAIIQGINYDFYKRWKNIIDQPGIDGWCCKSPSDDPKDLVQTAGFVMSELDKPVHFLGVGKMTKTIVLIYMKKYFKHKISFDTNSYNVGSTGRAYYLPFSFNYRDFVISGGNVGVYTIGGETIDFGNFDFCSCEACNSIREIQLHHPEKYEEYIGPLISMHNLIYEVHTINYLKRIYKNGAKMRDFAKNVFNPKTAERTIKLFDFIDDVNKHGYEAAKEKWKHLFTKEIKTTRQGTLF